MILYPITEIPSGDYLCIYCNEFEKEITYVEKLLAAVEQQNLKIVGDYLCEVLMEWPIVKENTRKMLLRLQVPVQFQ